jgi:hypothetical protein
MVLAKTTVWIVTAILVGSGAMGLLASCANPVESDRVAALGANPTGQGNGPLHRPGQPCLVCHTDGGQARAFEAAGTVYASQRSRIAVNRVLVTIVDAAGRTVHERSNCAGNFYVQEESATLTFPLHAEIECTLPDGTVKRSVMGTRIDRDGSCATCHFGNPSGVSPGRLACGIDMPDPPFVAPPSCTDQHG